MSFLNLYECSIASVEIEMLTFAHICSSTVILLPTCVAISFFLATVCTEPFCTVTLDDPEGTNLVVSRIIIVPEVKVIQQGTVIPA